jgi:hypothetical protein
VRQEKDSQRGVIPPFRKGRLGGILQIESRCHYEALNDCADYFDFGEDFL